jgi:hypothetical protein
MFESTSESRSRSPRDVCQCRFCCLCCVHLNELDCLFGYQMSLRDCGYRCGCICVRVRVRLSSAVCCLRLNGADELTELLESDEGVDHIDGHIRGNLPSNECINCGHSIIRSHSPIAIVSPGGKFSWDLLAPDSHSVGVGAGVGTRRCNDLNGTVPVNPRRPD